MTDCWNACISFFLGCGFETAFLVFCHHLSMIHYWNGSDFGFFGSFFDFAEIRYLCYNWYFWFLAGPSLVHKRTSRDPHSRKKMGHDLLHSWDFRSVAADRIPTGLALYGQALPLQGFF